MSPQTLAILAAIAVAGYIILRLTRPMRQAAEKKRQARYDAAEAVRVAESRQKLEAELAEFPAKYRISFDKCRPYNRETLIANYLRQASEQFAQARNYVRVLDFYRASDTLTSAHFALWEAEKLAADRAGAEESNRLLRAAV